jgi:hypothetical protein
MKRAAVANAGWYTLATSAHQYPYGLGGLTKGNDPRAAFSKEVGILLGERDVETDRHLRRTPAAMQQGPNRLERGKLAYRIAKVRARKLGTSFRWTLLPVAGADHDSRRMVPSAARWLFSKQR